jgi:mannose-1-phosphate guanylyltransferase/phosphomannomutase
MKAVIMAGGEGTRLRPLTSNQPKPMVPILNRPVMEYSIELLKKYKIEDIVATLQFLPQLIKNYFGDGTDMNVNLNYATEETPLGTAGSVKNAEDFLDERFIVISGDGLTDIDLKKAIDFHKKNSAMVTIVLKSIENPLEFGVVITDENGKIQRFLEKPTWGEVFSDTINTGIYILEPEIFEYIPENKIFDFSKDLFPLLLKKGMPLYGFVAEGYWCDIGNLNQYLQAHKDILDKKAKIEPPGIKMLEDIWVGDGAIVHPSADLEGPVVIGQHAKIEAETKIGEYSVIGNNVFISNEAHTHRSIIWENSYIGPNVILHGAVVGRNCDIKQGARLEQGVIVGDECIIGEKAVVNHDVKVYPFKSVDGGATVNSSIIWESRGMRTLFGKRGVSGLVNIDITPELAVRLAMAYGTTLNRDARVVTSRDASFASRMITRSIISGLSATGIDVEDLRVTPAPVNRFSVHTGYCEGGIHVRVSPFDAQSLEVNFFDAQGIDVDEDTQRNIERYYYRGDFRRAFYNEIGQIKFPSRATEFYIDGLLKVIDKKSISKERFKVVVDHAYGSSSLILPYLVGKLGCDIVSLNAHTDESRAAISKEDFDSFLQQLSRTVQIFKADFGILIDAACEKVFLVDNLARRIPPNSALLLLINLLCKYEKRKGKIAVPLTVSSVVEEIANLHGRKVLRTRVRPISLMKASVRKDVIFAGAQGGGYIFPQLLPAYDAIMTFCRLLEFLSKAKEPLSKIVDSLPLYFLAHKDTFCPWDCKGLVMRRLMERAKDKNMELKDGIKIYDTDRWALIFPDVEEPLFHIYAEADSESRAQSEVNHYVDFIRNIVSSVS